jgi:hypothetical protein
MRVQIQFIKETSEETLSKLIINGDQLCYILEDQKQEVKVKGETRIPEGVYECELRMEGRHKETYIKKFGEEFHKGMIHLKDVPGFQFILFHIGNTDKDTDGCLICGLGFAENNGRISVTQSGDAYKKVYPIIRDRILSGEKVYFEIIRK